ncbi:MAG TPA: hypothetical protein VFD70_25370 [Anaerolineae bacterium]|nr:hypothetical protein [Anaerolineae bacterium]
MAKCQAGDCEVECAPGKGCGCIAESDNPQNCTCFCSGGETKGGLALDPGTLVDVSTSDLPLYEVATFFNTMSQERIIVPAHRINEPVTLDLTRQPFGKVLMQMGLKTEEGIEREQRRNALLMFLGGLAAGLVLFGFLYQREEN